MKITTTESSHWYHPDGRPAHGSTLREARKLGLYPSVSSILRCWPNDGLKNWLRGQDVMAAATTPRLPNEPDDAWLARVLHAADEESKKARDTGTRRHAIIEDFHRRGFLTAMPEDESFIMPYCKWFNENVREVRKAEHTVVHQGYGYAGTLDAWVLLKDGRECLLDVKNRKRVGTYDSDAMQLAAYAKAWADPWDNKDPAVLSVVLGTEKPEIKVTEWPLNSLSAWQCFYLCLQMWQASKNYCPTAQASTTAQEPEQAA